LDAMEWQAGIIERAANTLAYWIETTPEDKLGWCPTADASSKTRCIKEQMQECIGLNRGVAAKLRGDGAAPSGDQPKAEDQSLLVREIASSGQELADAVRNTKPEDLGKEHDLGFGPFPAAFLIEIATGNMFYHGGQLNFIQTLYGDTEFRFPGPDYNPLKDA